MQIQLKHLLFATTIIAATLAISPVLTIFFFALLAFLLLVNLIVPQRRTQTDSSAQKQVAYQVIQSTTGLMICAALFVSSIVLPLAQNYFYPSAGWLIQLWLVLQLLSYIASVSLLSFVRFDSHDRFEYRVIVSLLYIVFAPISLAGVFISKLLSSGFLDN